MKFTDLSAEKADQRTKHQLKRVNKSIFKSIIRFMLWNKRDDFLDFQWCALTREREPDLNKLIHK